MLVLLRRNGVLAASPKLCRISARLLSTGTATDRSEHFDIIIGGGGLVGTTLAAALAKNATFANKRVLLLEGAPEFKGFNASGPYQNRVSAINKNSIELFKSIEAWPLIEAARFKSVKQMQVWESHSDALIHFQDNNFASDVACIIENDLILDAVYTRLKDATNVQVLNKARIESVRLPKDAQENTNTSELKLQDGRSFTCDLLIGADGANSIVRKEMGVDVFSLNYERMGLVATLDLSDDAGDNSVAFQRFLPNGPVALLPLSPKQSSLVWSTSVSHAKQLQALPPAEFMDALNEAFCRQYPRVELADKALQALNALFGHTSAQNQLQYPPRVTGVQTGSRATFPLGFLHASSYVTTGVALVGDAAHRVHPLAGQGVNLGFSDVRYLVDTLATAAYAGFKLGDKQHLLKYERQCLTKNVPIMIGVHGLHTLYSTEFSPVVLLRSLGLQLTQNLPPIKNMFMRGAMG